MENNDKIYEAILGLQRQMGDLKSETADKVGAIHTENAKQTEILRAVHTQTTLTNGRVTKLENQVNKNTDYINNVKIRIATIGTIGGLVGGAILFVIKLYFKL